MNKIFMLGWKVNLTWLIPVVIILSGCTRTPAAGPNLQHEALSKVKIDQNLIFSNISFHPNGKLIAATGMRRGFGRYPTTIYGVDIRTGEGTQLIEEFGQDNPTWTPDGNNLSFTWSTTEESGIFLKNMITQEIEFFREGGDHEFSRDEKFLAISKTGYDPKTTRISTSVTLVDLLNGEEKLVFQTPQAMGANIRGMAWSPDSRFLLFAAYWFPGDEVSFYNLYMYDTESQILHLLLENTDRIRYPGWLHDRKWLFFIIGEENRLSFMHIEERCIIETEITHVEYPVLSPTENIIGFTFGDIYILDLNILFGSELERLHC